MTHSSYQAICSKPLKDELTGQFEAWMAEFEKIIDDTTALIGPANRVRAVFTKERAARVSL